MQVCLITQFCMGRSTDYPQCVAISRVVKCVKGVVTWFSASANHMHSARAFHNFTFRIPQFLILPVPKANSGHMQMSMRNGVTPKVKLTLTLTLTLTDTEGAILTLMLGYRSLYITWQQRHNCRIVCEFSLCILICILPANSTEYRPCNNTPCG